MSTKLRYPAIPSTSLTGNENLLGSDGHSLGSVLDFWRWAHSDLIGNTERGILAEYIVARAMDADHTSRTNWEPYDLMANGIKIEVKASGYIQSWAQNGLSKIQFGIPKTVAWNQESGRYEGGKTRHADVYVFCLLKHREQESINPLDLSRWEFYVVPTEMINKWYGDRESITLKSLQNTGIVPVPYEDLRGAVLYAGK